MRITIVLPFLNLTGGIRMMLQYSNWLHDEGHQITVVVPVWPYRFHLSLRQQLAEFRNGFRRGSDVCWMSVRCPVLRVPVINSRFLPPADVVVATSWPTAFDVAALHTACGRKAHVVMHHERGTGLEESIRRVYDLPLTRITISHAVKAELRATFGCTVEAVIPGSVDTAVFFPDGERTADTVCMLYHPDPRKGADDGLQALSMIRWRVPHVRVECCGTVPPVRLPSWIDFRLQPTDAELRRTFSRAAAFLYPSRYEGFGLPPLESMACGCPVVSTRVGAVPEFGRDGINALLVDAEDVSGMADRLQKLLTAADLRERLGENGVSTAAEYSISRGARQFERALTELAS